MKKISTMLFKRTISLMIVLMCACSFSANAQCRLLNETFDVNPVLSPTNVDGTWYPDRYRPAGFASAVLAGNNVLKISIDGILDGASVRPPGQQGTFYNTQGRKFNQCGGCVTVAKGDLWIPADWATKHRRSDMWATAFDNTNALTVYPIIGFRNPDGVTPGIYFWDGNVGWINSGVAIVYNSWYNVGFRLVGANIEYLVNNVVVGSISSGSSAYFGNIIMQAYNFNDAGMPGSHGTPDLNPLTNSYDAYWDNLVTTGTGGKVVTNTNTGQTFCSIQAAVDAPLTVAGNTLSVGAGTYNERITVSKSLIIQGVSNLTAIVDGSGLAGPGSGFYINPGIINVTIKNLTIKNFAGTSPNSYAGVYAVGGNNNLTIDDNIIKDNVGGSGIYANGPVNTVMINGNKVSGHSNAFGAARGIVIWNGLKENITITNNEVFNNNCCGIELQDGTGTGVFVGSNNVHDNGDNGIGLVGLMGPGANMISSNSVTNNGRFGIEIKNPNGSGANAGPGSVMIFGNTVSRTVPIVDVRDIAGIAVFRRGVLAGNVDVPLGVVINNNAISGYIQPSNSDGFGIVVEGINHTVSTNNVNGNDVGIQRQSGHLPYPGDGNQSNLVDTYFGRGNSPVTCGVTLTGNILTNTINTRDVGNAGGMGIATNTNTGESFCSIQAAIDDPQTLNSHTITVSSGTYNEQVLVNKGVKILGVGLTKPVVNYTGVVSGKPTLFDVSVPDVTIENMQLDVDLVKLSSGIIASGVNISNLTIKNNTINAVASSLAASFGGYGNRNAVSVNYAGYRIAAGGVNNVRYEGNTVTGFVQPNIPFPIGRYFRSGISLDEGGGNFTGNTSQAISHDVLVRFGSNGPVTVTNNICNGGGIELSEMNAGAGALSVTGNTFNAAFANVAAPGTAVLRLKNNYNSKVTNVSGNSFFDIEWGISMENYNSVTVSNNSFTPKAGSTTYHHVGVNTKSISTNSSTIVQVTIAANILNNIFNGSGVAGGAGVTFFNHDNDAASFGTFNVNENSFDLSIARAIEQDGQSGNSLGSTFPNYVGLLGSGAGSQTMMAPWTAAINGTCNWYGTTNNGTIATKVGAHVTYIPYLSDGTDNSGAIGFQPVPGSCNGSNVLTITCPANINVQCSSQVPPANVGSVTTSGTCPGVVVTHMGDVISNQTCANRYTITRTYQATDACGNTATCTQTITVNDITPPTITCPPNKTVSPTTLAGTVVTYTTPVVSDNCSGVGVPVRTAGPASGSTFPIGTTTVTYQVTDACGNTASCSFTVTVIDPYCDDQKKKAYVCHNGNTICVSVNAVPSHLNHGDYLGQCSTSLRSIVIEEPVTDGFRVNVSPNPSAGDFKIQVISKSMEPISVKVMDLSGKVLTVNSNVIKGSIVLGNELRPGTYIAEVIQGTSRQVIKLVKVN